jgi:hypothetical protein
MPYITRRSLIAGAAALVGVAPQLGIAQTAAAIRVLKDLNCGCCEAWVRILQGERFEVITETSFGALLIRHKLDNGIPQEMIFCHTGEIDGYFIEGHVPPEDIRKLLSQRPYAVGLAVPGMPNGSPGTGPEERREAYDVFLIRLDGTTEVFTSYDTAA